jgi:hypothetical protein
MDYELMERAAVSFGASVTTPEGNNGLDVYNWIKNSEMASYSLEPGYAINPKWAITPRARSASADLDKNGVCNISDVQIAIFQILQPALCGVADVDMNGVCNISDLQLVIKAVTAGTCVIG